MKAYLNIIREILDEGKLKPNRTGVDTIAIPSAYFKHKMSEGFPIITTKSVPFKLVSSELEFFIKGMTDKQWLIDNNNHIWDEWCSPDKVPYGNDDDTKAKMSAERELGPVYGWEWRHFGGEYESFDKTLSKPGVDQLEYIVKTLKKNPMSRQMVVSAWNPVDIPRMALPPCHYSFQVTVIEDMLNLFWNQRSVDSALGLPFNIASYGLLLHLLAKESGFKEGILAGFLGDTHIYINHKEGLKEQLDREPMKLPTLVTENFKSIFEWKYPDSKLENYKHHPKIEFKIAV